MVGAGGRLEANKQGRGDTVGDRRNPWKCSIIKVSLGGREKER